MKKLRKSMASLLLLTILIAQVSISHSEGSSNIPESGQFVMVNERGQEVIYLFEIQDEISKCKEYVDGYLTQRSEVNLGTMTAEMVLYDGEVLPAQEVTIEGVLFTVTHLGAEHEQNLHCFRSAPTEAKGLISSQSTTPNRYPNAPDRDAYHDPVDGIPEEDLVYTEDGWHYLYSTPAGEEFNPDVTIDHYRRISGEPVGSMTDLSWVSIATVGVVLAVIDIATGANLILWAVSATLTGYSIVEAISTDHEYQEWEFVYENKAVIKGEVQYQETGTHLVHVAYSNTTGEAYWVYDKLKSGSVNNYSLIEERAVNSFKWNGNHTYKYDCSQKCELCGLGRRAECEYLIGCIGQCRFCKQFDPKGSHKMSAWSKNENNEDLMSTEAEVRKCMNSFTAYFATGKPVFPCLYTETRPHSFVLSVVGRNQCGSDVHFVNTCINENCDAHYSNEGKRPHEPSDTWQVIIPNNCTNSGLHHNKCSNCGEYGVPEPIGINPFIHDFDTYEITIPQTCEQSGLWTEKCARNPLHTNPILLDPMGHNWGGWGLVNAPTCTTPDIQRNYCTRQGCGEYQQQSMNPNGIGHSYDTYVDTMVRTCTQSGLRTYICSNNSSHTYPELSDPMGHNWGGWGLVNAPTCTTPDIQRNYCTRQGCGEYQQQSMNPNGIGHSYDTYVDTMVRTCTQSGLRTYICSNNSSHTYPELSDPMGHNWGGWGLVNAPTCTTPDIQRNYCTRQGCGEYQQQSMNPNGIGHSYDTYVDTMVRTCTQSGLRTYICSNNSSHTYPELSDPMGHHYGSWNYLNPGAHKRTCIRCSNYQTAAHTPYYPYCTVCDIP